MKDQATSLRVTANGAPHSIGLASLGCAKNLVDSEKMLGLLKEAGYSITADASKAEVIIVNTCGFIESAKQESIDTALEMAGLKQAGQTRGLILTGCLAQRYATELLDEMPEVDAVVGTSSFHEIVDVVGRVLAGERVNAVRPAGAPEVEGLIRIPSGPVHSMYLKIAEGCNHRCAFCAIPSIRGAYHSRPLESVVAEAEGLVAQGARELVLIAQDTSAYGLDLYGRLQLPNLLRQVSAVEGVDWVRLLYTYPANISQELIEALATTPKVCRYLDIPLQHASDRLLASMRRAGSAESYLSLVQRLRREVPGISLRSTFIVGLPGETEDDFARLLDFMRESRFDHVGCFTYSPEEGTEAADMPDQIQPEIALERQSRVMEAQQGIAAESNRARIDTVEKILSDGTVRDESGRIRPAGRSEREAPEIDGVVFLDRPVETGRFSLVRITGAGPYDLTGQVETVL